MTELLSISQIALSDSFLCCNCDVISNSPSICPNCQGKNLISIARALGHIEQPAARVIDTMRESPRQTAQRVLRNYRAASEAAQSELGDRDMEMYTMPLAYAVAESRR